nr:MAG TPA_asm: hypothetical protein [Caudoviricetes sp.]
MIMITICTLIIHIHHSWPFRRPNIQFHHLKSKVILIRIIKTLAM